MRVRQGKNEKVWTAADHRYEAIQPILLQLARHDERARPVVAGIGEVGVHIVANIAGDKLVFEFCNSPRMGKKGLASCEQEQKEKGEKTNEARQGRSRASICRSGRSRGY